MTLTRTETIYVSMNNIVEGTKEYYSQFCVDVEEFNPEDLIKEILTVVIHEEDTVADEDEWYNSMTKNQKMEIVNLAVPIFFKLADDEIKNNVKNGLTEWEKGL